MADRENDRAVLRCGDLPSGICLRSLRYRSITRGHRAHKLTSTPAFRLPQIDEFPRS